MKVRTQPNFRTEFSLCHVVRREEASLTKDHNMVKKNLILEREISVPQHSGVNWSLSIPLSPAATCK